MIAPHVPAPSTLLDSDAANARSYARAILNILDDAASERVRLEQTQRAVLNILDDAAEEKLTLRDTQRALLNILEDAAGETTRLESAQRAVLNILEDSTAEQARLADTQRAILNILDDFDSEKSKVEQVNLDLRNEILERARTSEALRHSKIATDVAYQELEAFSHSVAHDLRAPLRSIDGFSEALLEDCWDQLDDNGKRYLKYVRDSAQHMGKLIDAMLNLSRVTRTEIFREHTSLSVIAQSVLARLRESQPERHVEAIVQAGIVANADAGQLDILLTNLLGNAWKFTGKRAFAQIEFAQQTDKRPTVYLVRDNGAGFDPAYSGKLFGVFHRLHSVEEFEGTGIGLATVRRIIGRHGGRVWAESALNEGATFYFTLEPATTV
jgi:signal transduction histidine kinase